MPVQPMASSCCHSPAGRARAASSGILSRHQSAVAVWKTVCSSFGVRSTLAGTLSAVKMHLPVAHLEAGDRKEPQSELQSLMRHSYAVFCLHKKTYFH